MKVQYAVCIDPVCIEKEVEEEDADWHCEVRHRIEHCTAGSTFTIKKLNTSYKKRCLVWCLVLSIFGASFT